MFAESVKTDYPLLPKPAVPAIDLTDSITAYIAIGDA